MSRNAGDSCGMQSGLWRITKFTITEPARNGRLQRAEVAIVRGEGGNSWGAVPVTPLAPAFRNIPWHIWFNLSSPCLSPTHPPTHSPSHSSNHPPTIPPTVPIPPQPTIRPTHHWPQNAAQCRSPLHFNIASWGQHGRGMLRNVGRTFTCIHTTPPTAECCGMWALVARAHAFTQPHRPRNAAECGLWWHVHMHSHNPTDHGVLRNVGPGGTLHAFTQPHRPRNAAECGLWRHIHMHSYNPTDRGMLRNVGSGGTFTCIHTTPPTAECCGM